MDGIFDFLLNDSYGRIITLIVVVRIVSSFLKKGAKKNKNGDGARPSTTAEREQTDKKKLTPQQLQELIKKAKEWKETQAKEQNTTTVAGDTTVRRQTADKQTQRPPAQRTLFPFEQEKTPAPSGDRVIKIPAGKPVAPVVAATADRRLTSQVKQNDERQLTIESPQPTQPVAASLTALAGRFDEKQWLVVAGELLMPPVSERER